MTKTGNNHRQTGTAQVASESELVHNLEKALPPAPAASTTTPVSDTGPAVPSSLGTGSVWLRYTMPQPGLVKGASSTRG